MENEKLWSLKIPIKKSPKDKEMEKFFEICKKKLGLIPNIIKTNSLIEITNDCLFLYIQSIMIYFFFY